MMAVGSLVLAVPAQAEAPLAEVGPINFSWALNGAIGVFTAPNAQFGAGSFGSNAPGDRTETPTWSDWFLKPEIKASYHDGWNGTIYGDVSAIYAQTVGDGDANLFTFTPNNPGNISLEEAYIGYANDLPFSPGDTFAAQFGRQGFVVDDGFLIGDGNLDSGRRGAYYLAPRNAFDGWGVVKINSTPVRADVFALRTTTDRGTFGGAYTDLSNGFNVDFPKTSFVGLDLTWFEEVAGATVDGSVNYADRDKFATFTYFHIYDADRALAGAATTPDGALTYASPLTGTGRQDLDVFSISCGGHLIPIDVLGLRSNATFYGNYVRQTKGEATYNGVAYTGVDAEAYFLEPGYKFADQPWAPFLFYRYSHFSGQDPNSSTSTAYDPLFYAAPGSRMTFGTYFLGDIVGQYNLFNSNENVHQVGVRLNPTWHMLSEDDSSVFDILYYHFDYDQLPAGVTSKNFAEEVDLAWEYTVDPTTTFYALTGFAVPNDGARQSLTAQFDPASGSYNPNLGNPRDTGRTNFLFEAFLYKSF